MEFETTLEGKRVLITGHSGFTGGWLALWLRAIGCQVHGVALPPDTEPNLFSVAGVATSIASEFGDVREIAVVRRAIERARPAVIFHLAAQPLVSRGFAQPVETFATNVMGTVHLLEAARLAAEVKAVVCVTTDKVYACDEAGRDYREEDRLGGEDPYSASKAAAELVADCYRRTMAARGNGLLVATARGGNVIGGGDWSEDRIVPDFVRAVTSSAPLLVRNPDAVRPWQHVLALVHGYLVLSSRLLEGRKEYAEAWNFGPPDAAAVPVRQLLALMGGAWARPEIAEVNGGFPENRYLRLDSSKARDRLRWQPALDLAEAVKLTAQWYRDYYTDPSSARVLTLSQIEHYRHQLRLHND